MLRRLFRDMQNRNPDITNAPACAYDPVLVQTIVDAWQRGQNFELRDAVFGPAHWKGGNGFKTFPYYRFLAGFVLTENCRSVLEIGTAYGGSAIAMRSAGADILTVDISDENKALHRESGIRKLTGDANGVSIVKQVINHFGNNPIDLLYIDAAHRFLPTITNLGLYTFLLKPRFVIIDDICLNPEMADVWKAVRIAYGAQSVNCADVVPRIRDANVGFGVVRWHHGEKADSATGYPSRTPEDGKSPHQNSRADDH